MALLLPALLSLMMFTMGLSILKEDVQRVSSMPRIIIYGLSCQLMVLPVFGFLVASASGMTPELKVGFIAICACPGGVLSNYIAFKARGSVALSVSLTLFSSIITVFTIPFILNFAQIWVGVDRTSISLPLGQTMLTVAKMTVLPIALGVVVHYRFPTAAGRMIAFLSPFCSVSLASYILYLWFQQKSAIVAAAADVGLAVLALMALISTFVYLTSRLLKIHREYRTTLIIETTIQNSALAFTITAVLMNNAAYAVPTVFYSVAMFLPALLLIFIGRKTAAVVAGT